MTEQLIYGLHAVEAVLHNPYRSITRLIVSADREDKKLQALLQKAENLGLPIEKLNQKQMNQRYTDLNHQGIAALAKPLPQFQEADLPELLSRAKSPCLILILDGVTDPHNLGACLRSANAAGVDFVIIPKDKSASLNPTVSKVACGAAETIPLVRVTNLARTMERLKQENIWLYGAAGEASESLYQLDCRGNMALVMGSEGEGLRRLTRDHCDGLYAIPMAGSVSSLNVSVATGVSLFEVVRQRSKE